MPRSRNLQRWSFVPLLCAVAVIGLAFSPGYCGSLATQETAPSKGDPAKAASEDEASADKSAAEDSTKTDAPAVSEADAAAAAKAFADQMQQWKELVKELRRIHAEYQTASDDELPGLQKQWNALIAKGNSMVPALRTAGIAAYRAAPNADRDLTGFLVKLAEDETKQDRYESSLEICNLLIENDCDRAEIYSTAAFNNFALQNFDTAEEQLNTAKAAGAITPLVKSRNLEALVPLYKDYWAEEQKIRAEEADDNLPRVKLTTNKGEIVLELFENEAPQTVGNFVSLVESGFYDGLTFHRVIPNFMAQGGDPKGDGTGGPGYSIPCECYKANARKHFRGSLSMAHAGRDTGGSQFFITFLPTAQLNGKHTVFGRVIEGMDVLAKLQRRDPNAGGKLPVPDTILKAEVLRKRDHEYKPTKVES
jgi:cyclophilin family peptidyl-prolyl cis-trans isomerase